MNYKLNYKVFLKKKFKLFDYYIVLYYYNI